MNRFAMFILLPVALSLFLMLPSQALACADAGVSCTSNSQCCDGNCDSFQNRCGAANGTSCTLISDCAGGQCATAPGPVCRNECRSSLGLPCIADTDCFPGLSYCDLGTGLCAQTRALNAACTVGNQCITGYCPNLSHVCTITGTIGQPCNSGDDCFTMGTLTECDENCPRGAGWCCIISGQSCTADSQCCDGTCMSGSNQCN